MQKILNPTINYAENGFPVTELVSYYMNISDKFFNHYPNFKETYYVNESTPKKGEIFKNLDLANTLKLIAKKVEKNFMKAKLLK